MNHPHIFDTKAPSGRVYVTARCRCLNNPGGYFIRYRCIKCDMVCSSCVCGGRNIRQDNYIFNVQYKKSIGCQLSDADFEVKNILE